MSRYRGPKLRISRRLGTLPGLTKKNQIKQHDQVKMEKLLMIPVKKQLNTVFD
jgi:hypothetical protein